MSKKKSGNALKHGIYSQEVLLPGEKPRDYALLRARLYDEWNPEGPTEEELVERLAALLWKRRRLHMHNEATMPTHGRHREPQPSLEHPAIHKRARARFSVREGRQTGGACLERPSPIPRHHGDGSARPEPGRIKVGTRDRRSPRKVKGSQRGGRLFKDSGSRGNS